MPVRGLQLPHYLIITLIIWLHAHELAFDRPDER